MRKMVFGAPGACAKSAGRRGGEDGKVRRVQVGAAAVAFVVRQTPRFAVGQAGLVTPGNSSTPATMVLAFTTTRSLTKQPLNNVPLAFVHVAPPLSER